MRLIDADALQKAIDSLPISPLTQEVFKGHVDAAIANAPTVAKGTNVLSNGWISVKDRLPEKNGRYLVCEYGEAYSAEYEKNRPDSEWTDDYEGYFMKVSHWMPLPEPPEEEA